MGQRRLEDEFWAWSCEAYARPGVSALCLALQDERGVDVNLALFCLWWGEHGVQLTHQDCAALEQAIAPIRQDILKPLRTLRRQLKHSALPEARPLAETLAALELEIERRAQRRLLRVAGHEPQLGIGASAPHNLATYLDWLDVPSAEGLADQLAALVQPAPCHS